MDTISQLQDKLHDMTKRISHELRYFQYCAPAESTSLDQKLPLLDGPFEETKETLAYRARISSRAFIALNLQFDEILATLPTDEGDETFQNATLEELNAENEKAGQELELEKEEAQKMLKQVREAMKAICDDRCTDTLERLSRNMDLISRLSETDEMQGI